MPKELKTPHMSLLESADRITGATPTITPAPAATPVTPLSPASVIPEVPEGERPTHYATSPRHSGRVVRPPGTAQLNARVSADARFHANEFLSMLQREGRPTYMYELLDVLLLNLRDPQFALQVREMLDHTEVE